MSLAGLGNTLKSKRNKDLWGRNMDDSHKETGKGQDIAGTLGFKWTTGQVSITDPL